MYIASVSFEVIFEMENQNLNLSKTFYILGVLAVLNVES